MLDIINWFRPILVAAAISFQIQPAAAEVKIGFRQLGSTKPVAVQRGTSSILNLHSSFSLDETHTVFFDRPGIKMTFQEKKPIASPRKGRGRLGKAFRFKCDVPADQEPGIYEVRVATTQAVSSITHLLVSEFPVVSEEKKENGKLSLAQQVKIPIAISGECERTEDVDFYAFAGTADQELTLQVYAQRVTHAVHSMQSGNGVYLMDPILTLYGPNGQVIDQNDNFIGADSLIHCKLPETGLYTVEVRDARYVGNDKYVYCVEISDQPFVDAIFPLAVQRGHSSVAEIIGHQLGGTRNATIKAAADEQLGWKKFRLQTKLGETNPVPVLVSDAPQVTVGEAHNSIDSALAIELPAGVNGRFQRSEQTHFLSFEAIKGQYYLFEILSSQVKLPFDSVIEILDANGKKLAEADDGLQTKDSQLYFKAPSDGRFFVTIRDLHDRGGARFLYHLRAERSGPDFEVHGEYYYSQLAPGMRMIWFARINRLNGFDAPVTIHIDDLPIGVTLTPATIPTGMNHCALILSAAADAKIGASLVRIYGKAHIPDFAGQPTEVIRRGRITCELQTQGGGQARWQIKTSIVGVTKPMDLLSIVAEPSEITLKPGGKAEIIVRIQRNKNFKDPVTLATEFKYFTKTLGAQLPPGVTMSKSSTARLTGNKLEGKIILEASDKAIPVERLPIAPLARVSITFSITTNYASNPVFLTIPAEK